MTVNGANTTSSVNRPSSPRASFDDHPCLSALASCSGLVPCEACRMALGTHVIPKSLHAVAVALEAGSEPVAQVNAFLTSYAEAQASLIANIRQAAIAHEAKLAAAREAFAKPPPAAAIPIAPQTAPTKKARTAAIIAEEAKALDDLFASAVAPSAPVAEAPPKPKTKIKSSSGSPSTPARREEKTP